jgi:hypothetical protein
MSAGTTTHIVLQKQVATTVVAGLETTPETNGLTGARPARSPTASGGGDRLKAGGADTSVGAAG